MDIFKHIKYFIDLAKPGIIFGNLITLMGAFFLAVHQLDNLPYFHMLFLFIIVNTGLSLVIASGCVFNNYIDRDIDILMDRTKDRASVQKLISLKIGLIYGLILGSLGFIILYKYINILTGNIALIGYIFYVGFYSLWFKRNSIFGTAIGAISGAVPPVIGYTAITNKIDLVAIILFAILFIWQLPHFFAIGIYRIKDYQKAGIPLLPIKKGILRTKISMLFNIILFAIFSGSLYFLGVTNILYLIISCLISFIWIYFAIKGFALKKSNHNLSSQSLALIMPDADTKVWARKMFIISIIGITLLSLFMAF